MGQLRPRKGSGHVERCACSARGWGSETIWATLYEFSSTKTTLALRMMIWGLSGSRKVMKMCPDSRADIHSSHMGRSIAG